jgi:hypothetical protein
MERALDPELLSLALGEHEHLPSAKALADLLGEAELALLVRRPEVTEKLVEIGWYLHAVASSKYALRAYGLQRQRAAFKVAGHIFDIILHSPGLERHDRLAYCFAAQVAYLRSELDPNALAMYRREFAGDLAELGLLSHHHEVALSCGVALLGLDVGYVYQVTENLRDEVGGLVGRWQVDDIFSTPFGSAAGVASATRDIMTFLVYGRDAALMRARQILRRAVLSEPSGEDQISRWVAAHLLNLADESENASIWTVLPPEVPPAVRRAFAMGEPRILGLWPPQLDLLAAGEQEGPNALSSEVRRLFLSTPTSGGKTLLAQLLITSHIAAGKTSVCYVAPTRSLCREVRKSLESRLRYLGSAITDGLPEGSLAGDLLDFEPEVEVMTPERLSYLIRSDAEGVLDRFGLFVFDEVHTVGEMGRGWTLEQDLAYLHYATSDTDHRIVAMSAAVGNRHHFVQWMGQDQAAVAHFHSDWRGPRRVHAVWTTEADWNACEEEPIRSTRFPVRQRYPLYGRLDVRIAHTGETAHLRTTEPVGTLAFKYSSADGTRSKDASKSTAFYRMLVPIILHLSESGPVLVIESTRPSTVRMAKAIAGRRETVQSSETQPLLDLVEARLGSDHPLRHVLERGVAYHHGSLPSEIREGIEEAVAEGHLRLLVATTTMTEGVNLPVRSVVVASQGSHVSGGYLEYITGSKLINAIGRAGRAAKETEGIVVLARNASPSAADFDRLNPDDLDIQVVSMLASEEALEALAAFEDFRRSAEDAILQTTTGPVCDFVTFVWFVAAELERLGQLPTQDNVGEMLVHTLGWIQLASEHRDRWLSVVRLALGRYSEADRVSRRRWATAGTSIGSAVTLESIARALFSLLATREVPQDPVQVVDLIVAEGRLQQVLALPEAPRRRIYTRRTGQNRQEVSMPIDQLLSQWLRGTELVTLAETHLGAVPDIDFRFEQLGDFIYEYFEVFFPWVFGTIIAWTNELLESSGADTLLPRTVPAYVRWGVGSAASLELMASGISSRTLAARIAAKWDAEERDGTIRQWIRSMGVADWQERFAPSIAELRSLLDYSRNRRGGVGAELITRESAEVEVESDVEEAGPCDARLAPVGSSDASPVGIWAGDELVGRILSRDQVDVKGLLRTGLPMSVKFSASSGAGLLELRLVDPAG